MKQKQKNGSPEQEQAALSQADETGWREVIATESLRRGAGAPAQVLMLAGLLCLAVVLWLFVADLVAWATHRVVILLVLAGIGSWRWSWFVIQNTRAIIYRYFVYPKLRRQAASAMAASGGIPEVTIMATTYREQPWITRLVFKAVFAELSALSGLARQPRVVVATGCAEDEATIKATYEQHYGAVSKLPADCWPPELVLLREENGKRAAIVAALREIAQRNPHKDGAVVFLDGDTIMQPGFFGKVLPLFRLEPAVAAITTNENGYVKGPAWFAEWISLRLGLRHRTMCSVALSGKLLCLTGRLSVFRASVATNPDFIAQIEHDTLRHWLWGSFEMLSGDDKSTWYWLSRHGDRMLYVPDAMATTIEVVQGGAIRRAWANIRRWTGNSMRHSWRAIRLGPVQLGCFPWWSLIDQRASMFTVLFGPAVFLLALGSGRMKLAAGLALWFLVSRLAHSAIAWRHGRRWSAFYVPLILLSDWAVALTKIWVLFHPTKQVWLNRGARTLDSTLGSRGYRLQAGLAHYFWAFTCVSAIAALCMGTGFLPLAREARLFLKGSEESGATPAVTAGQGETTHTGVSGGTAPKAVFEPGIVKPSPTPRPGPVAQARPPALALSGATELSLETRP